MVSFVAVVLEEKLFICNVEMCPDSIRPSHQYVISSVSSTIQYVQQLCLIPFCASIHAHRFIPCPSRENLLRLDRAADERK